MFEAVTSRGAGSELRHFQMLKSEAVDTGFNRQRPQNSVNTTWRDSLQTGRSQRMSYSDVPRAQGSPGAVVEMAMRG